MKLETKYAYQKRIKELEEALQKSQATLYQYRSLMMRLYSWLNRFANKDTVGTPNASYGLEQMKELFK